MPGVFAEDAFIEILECGVAVDVVGDDPDPVVVAAVAGGPLGEPLELACSVSSIIPTVPTAAFPLVLEVALEGTRKCLIGTVSRCTRSHDSSFAYW